MAVEDILKISLMHNKNVMAFFLGIIYSFIGIYTAKMIFGSNPDMMAVAFCSILLIPAVNKILKVEEEVEARENKLSIGKLFTEHKDIFFIYLALFMGIFIAFLTIAIISKESSIFYLFKSQLKVAGITGQAIKMGSFNSLFANNLKVLIACLILSLIYGAGSILFIAWNASVWGAVFGYSIKTSSLITGQHPFITFLIIMVPVLPHLITEAMSYFSAAIAGGVMSKAIVKEEFGSDKFNHVATDSLILFGLAIFLVIIGALLEARF